MKRPLLTFILLFSIPSSAFAVNELWSAATQSNLDDARKANDPKYLQYKDRVDTNSCSNDDYGLQQAIMYKATGNASYCTKSFSNNGGCVAGANRNKTRDCFVERVLAYSICGTAVSASDKTTWESQLDTILALVQSSDHGTRTWDTDELQGHYFGGTMYCLAKYGNLSNCITGGMGAAWGGVDATGDDMTTLRNAIYHYYKNLSGGTFFESSEYNQDTLYYMLQGVNAINSYYGADKFPEITALYHDFATFHVQYNVPGFSQDFQFGDVQTIGQRNDYRVRGLYAAMAHLDSDNPQMWYLWNSVYTNKCTRMGWGMFYDHDAVKTAPSGQTDFYANGAGIQLWHEGWEDVYKSFYASMMKPETHADHDSNGWTNFNLWRSGNWAIYNGKGYYGSLYAEANYLNTMLVNGGLPYVSQEARGPHLHEEGANYAYQAGLTGGNSVYAGYYDPPPESLHEWTRSHFYYKHKDGSDTIIIFDRVNAENPKLLPRYDRHEKEMQAFIDGADGKHEVLFQAAADPTLIGNRVTWFADSSETAYLDTFMPQFTYSEEFMNGSPCAGCGGYMGTNNPTLDYRIVLKSEDKNQYQSFANILHAGSTPVTKEITANAGETAKGYQVKAGTENLIVVFNGTDRTNNLPAPTTKSGERETKDPDRFNELKTLHFFKLGFMMSVATDGDAEVYVLDLDPDKSWVINIDGGTSQTIPRSDAGLYHTVLKGSGAHTITVNASGVSIPNPLETPVSSSPTETSVLSNPPDVTASSDPSASTNLSDPVVLSASSDVVNSPASPALSCAQDNTLCETAVDCQNNGYLWCNGVCKISRGDRMLIQDSCKCSKNDTDLLTCSCTVTKCADQIMAIVVSREETGDTNPDTLTWDGQSVLNNFVGSDKFWFETGETELYYLLNPEPGTHDLTVTYKKGASVDINLGMSTFCGLAQEAPEAVKTGRRNIAVTSNTDNAGIITVITSIEPTDFTPKGNVIKGWEHDNFGMTTALGYYQAGPAGLQDCYWDYTQGFGDRSGNVCTAFKAADYCSGE